ncbi:MAG: hypothetical protein GY938_07370 [Ketobacter sp.]|nr:hypothetical protein [Ketobacter sp.]
MHVPGPAMIHWGLNAQKMQGPALPPYYHLNRLQVAYENSDLYITSMDDDDPPEPYDPDVDGDATEVLRPGFNIFIQKHPTHPLSRRWAFVKDWPYAEDEMIDLLEAMVRQRIDRMQLFPFLGPKSSFELRRFLHDKLGDVALRLVWLCLWRLWEGEP